MVFGDEDGVVGVCEEDLLVGPMTEHGCAEDGIDHRRSELAFAYLA